MNNIKFHIKLSIQQYSGIFPAWKVNARSSFKQEYTVTKKIIITQQNVQYLKRNDVLWNIKQVYEYFNYNERHFKYSQHISDNLLRLINTYAIFLHILITRRRIIPYNNSIRWKNIFKISHKSTWNFHCVKKHRDPSRHKVWIMRF